MALARFLIPAKVVLADAMSKLDLTKKELEKEDEFEKRKKDAWASINIPIYEIGSRNFYGFFAPLKRTWLKYDVEKEQFWFNPNYKDTFLGGGTEIDVFGKNLHITNSRVTYESELKPLGTYEGSNAFGKQVTVYVADLQQYALDLPEFSDMKFFGRQMQSFKLPVARAALGGSLDDVGVLILGDLRKHGYAKIDSRKEPSIQVPLDQRITKHIFFVTPVCAYFFNIATQTVLSEIPHYGEGWGEV